MPRKSDDSILALLPKVPLLPTESARDFETLRKALTEEIKPQGIIEQIYVADLSYLTWEILRLRRCKTALITLSFRPALEKLLAQVLRKPTDTFPPSSERQLEIDTMMRQWMFEEPEKKNVLSLLESFRLDETAIEAQAIRHCLSDLEVLDRMLTSLESRRNKALGCVTEYRQSLARRLRESSDRLLLEKPVLQLKAPPSNKSAA